MMTIKQYDAPKGAPRFTIKLPAGARVLSVHPPWNPMFECILLAAVETTAPEESRTFNWCRSNETVVPGYGRYVGSVTIGGLNFIHLFEEES